MNLQETIQSVSVPDVSLRPKVQARLDSLTKPQGSLGRLETLARDVACMQGRLVPSVARKTVFLAAGDHGVTAEGVSAYPQAVTAQMVLNFLRGGAGINVLAAHAGARVRVIDAGVAGNLPAHPELIVRKIAPGTRNMARESAMTRGQAVACLEAGIGVFEAEHQAGVDLVSGGEMGIGNTTSSSAIVSAFTGLPPAHVTGTGTGLQPEGLQRKIRVVEQALAVNRPDPSDPLDVLAKVGGFEIGLLAGMYIAAAARRTPVVLDGFIATTAALLAVRLQPKTRQFMLAGHRSVEPGHAAVLEALDLEPLLSLNLRLGEGTGAALAMTVVEAAVRVLNEMATFEQASVSSRT